MSKYFDKLVQINESLDKELGNEQEMVTSAKNNFEAAIKTYSKQGLSDGDCLIWAFNDFLRSNPSMKGKSIDDISLAGFCKWLTADPNETELYLEEDKDTIEIPKDSLTDDQKKDILKDNGVDASTVDGMKSSDELDSAMDATLNNNELKKESSDGEFILKIVDEDLDIDGYVSEFNGKDVDITPIEGEAKIYGSEDEARKAIEDMCNSCHYDPETFTVMPKDDEDDDENWTALEDPEMSI